MMEETTKQDLDTQNSTSSLGEFIRCNVLRMSAQWLHITQELGIVFLSMRLEIVQSAIYLGFLVRILESEHLLG